MKTIMPSASAGSQNLPTRLIDFFFPPFYPAEISGAQRKGKTQISVTSAGSSDLSGRSSQSEARSGRENLNTLRYLHSKAWNFSQSESLIGYN